MKKTSRAKTPNNDKDTLQSEYRLDYRQARPNRFAGRIDKERTVVVLDADISKVFTTPESVNSVLRALIETMPQAKSKTGSLPAGVAKEKRGQYKPKQR